MPGNRATARLKTEGNRSGKLRRGLLVGAAIIFLATTGIVYGPACLQPSRGQDAAESQVQEYNLKLAFLINFGRYVHWPSEAFSQDDAPFVVGVLGTDPFHGALERITANRKIQGRTVIVRHFATAADYQPCHMLFVAHAVLAADQAAALSKAGAGAVLIVGESEGFATAGGGINLYRDQDNVRFEVNVETLRSHNLQPDAKLLSLARIVKGN